MEKYKLKQCFAKLALHTSRSHRAFINIFYEERNYQFCRKLHTLVKRHKKETINSLFAYAKFVKSYKKVRVIAVIHNRFMKQLKQTAFARLARYQRVSNSKTNITKEVQELKIQLQDMTVQL
jgi:hypothetical protein